MEAADRALLDAPCEFPVIRRQDTGEAYEQVWMTTPDPEHGNGICRLDVNTGAMDVWQPEQSIRSSEPLWVPSKEAEHAGWLLSLCFDAEAKESSLNVFEASRPSQGPPCQDLDGAGAAVDLSRAVRSRRAGAGVTCRSCGSLAQKSLRNTAGS